VLLMDEPLSVLDAKVRVGLRRDIRLVQQKLGITTLYVTHDQEEALVVSDRIMVMEAGEVRQLGTPREIYEEPANLFVASFIGTSNFLEGRVVRADGTAQVALEGATLEVPALEAGDGATLRVALRPEHLWIITGGEAPEGLVTLDGEVELVSYLGPQSRLQVKTRPTGAVLEVEAPSDAPESALPAGSAVKIGIKPEAAYYFDAASGARVR
jgi:ABC-type Fe3+/spermidine/putrescine transport system ATPase subunit